MIEILRHIIMSITAAAVLGSVLIAITQGGAHREIVKIAVGLMLVLALINPLKNIRIPKLSHIFKSQPVYYDSKKAYQDAVLKEFTQQVQRYIENKAEENGITCKVKLYAQQRDSEILFLSAEADTDDITQTQRAELIEIISEQCGISSDNIIITQVEK